MTKTRWLIVSLLALTACSPPPPINVPPVVRPTNPPVFGTPVTADVMPPPISGGTLLVLSNGLQAVAADPDRDAVFVTPLDGSSAVRRIALERGEEPGRAIEDARGRVHVALRGTSHVAVIDPQTATVVERREVCRTPRGIAFDRDTNTVHVACASGQLVSLDATTGEVSRRLELDRDLRDVVVLSRGRLAVSRFRTAEVLEISAAGTLATRSAPPVMQRNGFFGETGSSGFGPSPGGAAARAPQTANAIAHIAWRMVPASGGRVVMLHQRALDKPVQPSPGGYGSGGGLCPTDTSIVETSVSTFDTNSSLVPSAADTSVNGAVLAVDVAVAASGQMAFAVPGNARVPGKPQIVRSGNISTGQQCLGADSTREATTGLAPGQVTAVAFAGETLVAQLRQPAALYFPETGRTISLSTESREDTGHSIFHSNSGGGLACASCHAEGDDDGHTWNFASIGLRRTQTFRGGLTGTEPFHWDGDMQNIGHLMNNVFTERMSGPVLSEIQVRTLQGWIDRLPVRAAPRTMDTAAARGRELFFNERVACASCHSGNATTNNQNSDVGTGAAFQVPTLRGIAWRAPFMHNGCAPTLLDRFTNPACGGGDRHGVTSHLSAAQVNDLVAYLETL